MPSLSAIGIRTQSAASMRKEYCECVHEVDPSTSARSLPPTPNVIGIAKVLVHR